MKVIISLTQESEHVVVEHAREGEEEMKTVRLPTENGATSVVVEADSIVIHPQ